MTYNTNILPYYQYQQNFYILILKVAIFNLFPQLKFIYGLSHPYFLANAFTNYKRTAATIAVMGIVALVFHTH